MILGFKSRFKGQIMNGQKIHSIREDVHGRWKPGMKIHFATGARTKFYNQFWYGHCKSVQDIRLIGYGVVVRDFMVLIDNRELSWDEIDILAKNDGFESYIEFADWFIPKEYTNYAGKLIHWTNKIY